MIHRAVPAAEVDATVAELVATLADGATVALGLAKWLLHTGATTPLDEHLRNEAFAMELSSRSEDFREGLKAFRREAVAGVRRALRCTSGSIVERRGPVGWLIFDRPDVGNAMDAAMMAELERGLARARRRPRRPGHREHRQRATTFQTGLDVAAARAATRRRCASSRAAPATPSCASPRGTTRCGSR